jgi:sensor histidine kinase YesM
MKQINTKSPSLNTIELIIYVVIWATAFSIPFLNYRINNLVAWDKIFNEWIKTTAMLIIFLINAYLLVPRFLFQKKYLTYIASALLAILFIAGSSILIQVFINPPPMSMPPMNLGPGMPPMELGAGMPAPIGFKPTNLPEQRSFLMIFITNLILSLLVVGAGTAIKMVSQWIREESRREDAEKEQLKTELAFLRHQVSPHFFMNTLNNIHALIDINAEDAKNTIIELSTMMRYMLYDTAQGHTTLKKEIHFIESYIALMQLRFTRKAIINLEIPENIPDLQIPPMLFISFLENAFKHGVSYQKESYVSFKLHFTENRLNCTIANSISNEHKKSDINHSGIGLTNIKKSLKLLFGNDYTLEITESKKEFNVNLSIPI